MKHRAVMPMLVAVVIMVLYACQKEDNGPITVTDLEGHSYKAIHIGNQFWMTENLRVGCFRDGTPILGGLDDVEWQSAAANPVYALYPDYLIDGLDTEQEVIGAYGLLYSWAAVADPRGLCPVGWHVPTDDDWEELITYLGGEDDAGGKMKSTSTEPHSHPRWDSPNTEADDSYGFEGLPSGYRTFMGGFDEIGYSATWWSSTEFDDYFAGAVSLYCYTSTAEQRYKHKKSGLAIRCVRD